MYTLQLKHHSLEGGRYTVHTTGQRMYKNQGGILLYTPQPTAQNQEAA